MLRPAAAYAIGVVAGGGKEREGREEGRKAARRQTCEIGSECESETVQ
jgi:hypothetical protein